MQSGRGTTWPPAAPSSHLRERPAFRMPETSETVTSRHRSCASSRRQTPSGTPLHPLVSRGGCASGLSRLPEWARLANALRDARSNSILRPVPTNNHTPGT